MFGYGLWFNTLMYTKTRPFDSKPNVGILSLYRTFTIDDHYVQANDFNYNHKFMFPNINYISFNREVSLKLQLLNEEIEKNAFGCEACIFNE